LLRLRLTPDIPKLSLKEVVLENNQFTPESSTASQMEEMVSLAVKFTTHRIYSSKVGAVIRYGDGALDEVQEERLHVSNRNRM
jgi:hypothetical protein